MRGPNDDVGGEPATTVGQPGEASGVGGGYVGGMVSGGANGQSQSTRMWRSASLNTMPNS